MQTITCELRLLDGTSLGVILLAPKRFKSGRIGYFGTGKLVIDGHRCQCQAQTVRIEKRETQEEVSDNG